MPFRDEMSKRISHAFAVTERKANITLREKAVLHFIINYTHVFLIF